MRKIIIFLIVLQGLLFLKFVTPAHYIVGYVENAKDGTSPNGRIVELSNSYNETLTDVVGYGKAQTSNTYMIDCEMFNNPCTVGETLYVRILNDNSGYFAKQNRTVIVGGFGYDLVENISLNSPPILNITFFDDDLLIFPDEIDLLAGGKKKVYCSGKITELDGKESIVNVSAKLYNKENSFPGDIDNKNKHYTNNSCFFEQSNQSDFELFFNCTFDLEYYAFAGDWNCIAFSSDNLTASGNSTRTSKVNELLAIEVLSPAFFNVSSSGNVSNETKIMVKNYGNVFVNLSLSGYGESPYDNYSMVCIGSNNISIENMKYNLTSSNPGEISLEYANILYKNLSSYPVTNPFNLPFRLEGYENLEVMPTYWRLYVPYGISGICSGRIVFAAVRGS